MQSEWDGMDIPGKENSPECLGADGRDRLGVRSCEKRGLGDGSPDHRGPEKTSRGRQGAREAHRQEPATRSVLHRGEGGQEAHCLDLRARPELQWLLSPHRPGLWPLSSLPRLHVFLLSTLPPPPPTMTRAPWP